MKRFLLTFAALVVLLVGYGFGAWVIYVNTSNATVHEGQGVAYPIVGQLKYGEKALLLQEEGGWYHVLLKNGKKGWMHYSRGTKVKMSDEEARKEFGLTAETPEEVDEAQFFQKIGADIVPREIEQLLNTALSNQAWSQRKSAIDKLAELGSPDALGALMEVFDTGDEDAAKAALFALSKKGDDTSLAFMAERIKNPNVPFGNRKALIDALFLSGEKGQKALSALLSEIPEQNLRDYAQRLLSTQ